MFYVEPMVNKQPDGQSKTNRRMARGERVREIREDLELSGEVFAARVEQALRAHGVTERFTQSKLSQLEGGKRDITPEEATVIGALAPAGIEWLVFGRVAKARRQEATPSVRTTAAKRPLRGAGE